MTCGHCAATITRGREAVDHGGVRARSTSRRSASRSRARYRRRSFVDGDPGGGILAGARWRAPAGERPRLASGHGDPRPLRVAPRATPSIAGNRAGERAHLDRGRDHGGHDGGRDRRAAGSPARWRCWPTAGTWAPTWRRSPSPASPTALARRWAGDARFAFGTWKIEVLGAFSSALVLGVVALAMAVESALRLLRPEPIDFGAGARRRGVGLVVNLSRRWCSHGQRARPRPRARSTTTATITTTATGTTMRHARTQRPQPALGLRARADRRAHLGARHRGARRRAAGGLGVARPGDGPRGRRRDRVVGQGAASPSRRACCSTARWIRPWSARCARAIESDGDAEIADLHVWRVGRARYACSRHAWSRASRSTPDAYRARLAGIATLAHVSIEVNRCPHETAVRLTAWQRGVGARCRTSPPRPKKSSASSATSCSGRCSCAGCAARAGFASHWDVLRAHPGPWKEVKDNLLVDDESCQTGYQRVRLLPALRAALPLRLRRGRRADALEPAHVPARRHRHGARAAAARTCDPIDFDGRRACAWCSSTTWTSRSSRSRSSARDLPLDDAVEVMDRFGRPYPPYWDAPGQGAHCTYQVEFLDAARATLLAASDYGDRDKYVSLVRDIKQTPLSLHWEYLLQPAGARPTSAAGRSSTTRSRTSASRS